MSSVRMCDNCGAIFSEAADGWQTGRVSTVSEDEFGSLITQQIQQDRCPKCAVGVKGQAKKQPRIDQAASPALPDPEEEALKEKLRQEANDALENYRKSKAAAPTAAK